MNSWNDPRARELNRLQLALATFALQLDAFELQTVGLLRSISRSRDEGYGRELGEGGKIARQ
ncbi:hypothetical protein [Bradyrhizobium sp.]|uniref:hypothetical protein n=1 Tax=Bradyrhizobium sp. TaxID=376 RepID=UPI00262048AD|nr:hypothetical protein [Bradyrhizobium sp.]